MDFEQLKIFVSVVENHGFTKAAESLYISHSTTSRKVAALEESLNVRLFERDTRSVELTEAGKLLYLEGRSLLRRAEELETAVKYAGSGHSGKLRAASLNIKSEELSNFYREFCDLYPGVVLEMFNCALSEVFGKVESDKADFGVTFSYMVPENTDDFEIRKFVSEKFCIIAPEGHPLALRGTVSIKDLRMVNYISVGEQRSDFTRKLEESILKGRHKSALLSVSTLESLFMQVKNGNGVSLVPYPIARLFGTECSILDIEDLNTNFDIVFAWKKESQNKSLLLLTELLTHPETLE